MEDTGRRLRVDQRAEDTWIDLLGCIFGPVQLRIVYPELFSSTTTDESLHKREDIKFDRLDRKRLNGEHEYDTLVGLEKLQEVFQQVVVRAAKFRDECVERDCVLVDA